MKNLNARTLAMGLVVLLVYSLLGASPLSPAPIAIQQVSESSVLDSGARTVTTTSGNQINTNSRCVTVFLNVTVASGTGGLTLRIVAVDPASGNSFFLNAAPTAVIATGQYAYVLGSGVTSSGGSIAQATAVPLPKTWRVSVVAGDSSSYTYSVSASMSN
jgi:hypothetical protein